jgi:hypothetical protein
LAFSDADKINNPQKYGKIELGFTYSSVDAEDGTPYAASYRLTLNGIGIGSGNLDSTGTVENPTTVNIDVTNRINKGVVHNFVLTVTDDIGNKKLLRWTINYIDFSLTSRFNDMREYGVNATEQYVANVYGAGLNKKVSLTYNGQTY